jgi:hypothetical protein
MRMFRTSAGLLPGVTVALCVSGLSAFADDLRATQVLVEGGVFLAHAETEAAFARLDAPKPDANALLPKLTAYWEGGGASFGQADSSRRIGSGGSTSQMRLGVERGFNGAIVGAMASAGFGGVGSGDLGSQVVGQHVDIYGRVDGGSFFTKLLFGGSMFDFSSIRRGPENGASKASAMSYGARAAAQFGANLTVRGVKVTPTVALATYANRLGGYDECGGATPFDFNSRLATAAIGSFRLNGSRSFRVGPTQSVELRGFVGTEDVLGYSATRAVAVDSSGLRQRLARESSPTGRGVVGGLGVGTTLAPGVSMTVDYDYGRRDSISTHSSRARLGVSF